MKQGVWVHPGAHNDVHKLVYVIMRSWYIIDYRVRWNVTIPLCSVEVKFSVG